MSDTPTELTRLNKRMAELGLCSRREADAWIEQGWVLVNGRLAEMGVKVGPKDRVEVDPRAKGCLLYTSPSPRDYAASRMPSSA